MSLQGDAPNYDVWRLTCKLTKLDISISPGSRIWVMLRIDPKADARAKVAPLCSLS